MFLRQLSSTFLLHSRPVCSSGFRSSSSSSSSLPRPTPAPHPWWSIGESPSRHPHLPLLHPAACPVFPGRRCSPQSTNPAIFSLFSTSTGLMMERSDKEPPHKRRRSFEEKSPQGRAAGVTGAKDRGSTKEQHHLDPRPNYHLRDKGGGKDGAGSKDGSRRHEAPNQTRSSAQQQRLRDSQPAGARTQTPNPQPGPPHRPNVWFTEQQGGCRERSKGPPGSWPGHRSSDGEQGAGLHPTQRWQVAPPPPPVAQQQVKVKSLQRHWVSSPACRHDIQPPGDSRTFDFSVMSYNILSQQLLQENSHLYQHCHPRVLPWSHRLPNLLAEIQQLNADILCLQEVQEDHYKYQIKPALQALGYHCEYKKRTGRKPDGCAIIFKTSRLSLLSSNPVEFLRPGDALLDRDNVGLVVLLRPNDVANQSDPSSFICVANTHLLYNTRRGDIKLAQLAILLAEIGRLSRLPGGLANPVVLCGDFNSTPRSPLYRFLTTGCLDYRGLHSSMVSGQEDRPRGGRVLSSPLWSHSLGINHQCRYESGVESSSGSPSAVEGGISNLSVQDQSREAKRIEHGLKLQSSYQHHLQPDGRAEVTTCHSQTAMTVDYILFTPPESIIPPSLPGGRGLQLLGRLSLVGQSELQEVNGLPNQHHSSDHLPLLARFRLRR